MTRLVQNLKFYNHTNNSDDPPQFSHIEIISVPRAPRGLALKSSRGSKSHCATWRIRWSARVRATMASTARGGESDER